MLCVQNFFKCIYIHLYTRVPHILYCIVFLCMYIIIWSVLQLANERFRKIIKKKKIGVSRLVFVIFSAKLLKCQGLAAHFPHFFFCTELFYEKVGELLNGFFAVLILLNICKYILCIANNILGFNFVFIDYFHIVFAIYKIIFCLLVAVVALLPTIDMPLNLEI